MTYKKDIFIDNVLSSRGIKELLSRKEQPARNIWVISDYEKSSSIMKEMLLKKGYNVEALKSTSAPVERINDTEIKPDLIILDSSINGFNDILKEAKMASVPAIVLMAKEETKNVAKTLNVTVIKKPITNDKAFLRFIEKKLNKDQSVSNYR